MLVYLRNFSIIFILCVIGCFMAFVGFVFCLICILLSPLLALHIKKFINFSMTTESDENETDKDKS